MRRVFRIGLPQGRLRQAVVLLAGGTALNQAIVILASPILTRLYTPADFGVLAVFSTLLGVLGVAVCLRYDIGIPLAEDEPSVVNLAALSISIAAAFSLIVGLSVWYWRDSISDWTGAEPLRLWLWMLPFSLFAMGCYKTFNYWAIRRQGFGRIARTRLSQAIGQVLASMSLGWLVPGPAGLLVGQIIGQSGGVASLGTWLGRNEREHLREIKLRSMARVAARFRRLPMLAAGAAVLEEGSRLLPGLLLAVLYGTQVAGWFALAERIMGMPMRLVGNAVGQVYLSEAPRLLRSNRPRMYALFMSTTWRLFAFGALAMPVVLFAGPELFGLIFGATWFESGQYAQFLALMYLARLTVGPPAQTLIVLQRQDLQIIWDASRFVMLLLVFLGAYWSGWTPLRAVAVFSIGMTVCYVALFVVTRLVLLERLRAAADQA